MGLCSYILYRSLSQSLLGVLPTMEWREPFPDYFLENGFYPMSCYSPIQLIYLYIVYRCVHSSSFFSKLICKFYHSALVCPKTQEPSGHWLQEEEKNTMAGRLALSPSTLARSVAGIGSVLAFPLEDGEEA